MDGHFRAFSFVDRIISVLPGVKIGGIYRIPAGISEFPQSLAAEAVGQLAAWSAMAAFDFKRRPVAGIAAAVELLSPVRPGQTLELAADLESVESDAVAYGGTAHCEGRPVLRLVHCVGPMLPQEDFDDPQAVKARFSLLCQSGAPAGGFAGVPPLPLEDTGAEAGQWRRATLHVPQTLAVFADHFARRPVLPGTLSMHKTLELADRLMKDVPAASGWTARTISGSKVRAFTLPGESLEIEVRLARRDGDTAVVAVEARKGERAVGASRITFQAEGNP